MNRASNMALVLAKSDVDRRLNEMNNLREQINHERGDFVSRKEYEDKREALNNRVQELQRFMYMATGGLVVLQFVGTLLLHYWHGP